MEGAGGACDGVGDPESFVVGALLCTCLLVVSVMLLMHEARNEHAWVSYGGSSGAGGWQHDGWQSVLQYR